METKDNVIGFDDVVKMKVEALNHLSDKFRAAGEVLKVMHTVRRGNYTQVELLLQLSNILQILER